MKDDRSPSPMKLTILMKDILPGKDGAALMLCDEEGRHLPGQVATEMKSEAGEASRFTVTFVVDGEDVRTATDLMFKRIAEQERPRPDQPRGVIP